MKRSTYPNALHAEMIERIEALERAMADLQKHRQHGIGHNNPPEPIEPAPLSENELDEISQRKLRYIFPWPAPRALRLCSACPSNPRAFFGTSGRAASTSVDHGYKLIY
jgi:hypothetical protein